MSCVYVIRSAMDPTLIKIGETGDWSRRSRELKVGSKTALVCRFPIERRKAVEKAAHRNLSDYRLPQSEWFRLSEEQLQHICQQLQATAERLSAPPPTPEELAEIKAAARLKKHARLKAQEAAAAKAKLDREKAWHSQPLAMVVAERVVDRLIPSLFVSLPVFAIGGFASALLAMGCPDQNCKDGILKGGNRASFAVTVLALAAAGINAAADEVSKRKQFHAQHPTC